MKKTSAKAQVRRGGELVTEVDFAYEEATNVDEGEKLSQIHYKCSLVEVFNRYHRMKEIDKTRRMELVKLEDPLRNLKSEVRKLLKEADEESLKSFVTSVKG